MEAISIILTIISIGSLILKFASKASGGSSGSGREPEYMITANMKMHPQDIANSGIETGELVTLTPASETHKVDLFATGTSWTPVLLGSIVDAELFYKLQQRKASAKIYAINGNLVTVELKYR
jgi:hypothetical protein